MNTSSSINTEELNHFESMASHWWDQNGPLKPLHKMNPTRLRYITSQICAHYDRHSDNMNALDGLSVLDIGCGGGLVCEPLARLGANVTGIDAGKTAIDVATNHAKDQGLDITYICETSDVHKGQYDVVLALEIIEHIDDLDAFVQSALALLKPNGLILFSTLNRTAKSFAFGVVAAEYILRWLPHGTHNWKKFVKPSELAQTIERHNMAITDIHGITYNPMTDLFTLNKHDVSINYFLTASHKK